MRLLSTLSSLALHDQLAERHRGRAEEGDDRRTCHSRANGNGPQGAGRLQTSRGGYGGEARGFSFERNAREFDQTGHDADPVLERIAILAGGAAFGSLPY
jgi:hypothetical protein